MKSALGLNNKNESNRPISNPFGDFSKNESDRYQGVTLRSRRGDQTVEVQLPGNDNNITNFEVPLSPGLLRGKTGNSRNFDESYSANKAGITDREITGSFPQGNPDDNYRRAQIEQGLGLTPSEGKINHNSSYLAQVDKVKQLYKLGRYEAGLIEIDQMVREYPTNPKLYEMRGTLLSRLGYEKLAISSWSQALKLNPKNKSLQKFVGRRRNLIERRPASK